MASRKPSKPRTSEQNARYYANRTAKAKARGYTGYPQLRKVNEYIRDFATSFMDRIDTEGFDWSDLDQSEPEYWIWFRVNYGKGSPA